MRECVTRFIPEYCSESQELRCWSINGAGCWLFCCCSPILAEAFPKDFADHKKHAGFLLPRLFPGK
jgi:hypothetical protein